MGDIPPDIYNYIHELAVQIVNASALDDVPLTESLTQRLREYYNIQVSMGRAHPFLTEALADYTDDPIEAVRLYKLALIEADQVPDEPKHTKMIQWHPTAAQYAASCPWFCRGFEGSGGGAV